MQSLVTTNIRVYARLPRMKKTLILGSTSPFRREVLNKLRIPFDLAAPDIDETPLVNELPEAMIKRLSLQKAEAVAKEHPNALIISSDQCSVLDGRIIGKPHTYENAFKQLRNSSGRRVSFLTGLCLYDANTQAYQLDLVPFSVDFRELSDEEIDRYLRLDEPYNCAGSFKSEGLGITLFERMVGEDPNTLMGLPLIRLCEMLREYGYALPPENGK